MQGLNGTYDIERTEVTLELEKSQDAKEGYHYHVVYGKLLNPSHTTLCATDFGAASWNGGNEYESKVLSENSTEVTFMESDEETNELITKK